MKLKSHSGTKKRVKVKKSGAISVDKAGRRHLLVNKSKRQKKLHKSGMPIDKTRMDDLRRLLPGKVTL